ncbi:MAG: hypothetical protein LKJ83_10650 [Eubacteriaceae bacterium]|nr:hypothetical protein [Eubacteriaceae bacterium]
MYSRLMVGVVAVYMVSVVVAFAIHNTTLTIVMGAAAVGYMAYTIIRYRSDKKNGRALYGYTKVIGYQAAICVMFALMSYSFSLQ